MTTMRFTVNVDGNAYEIEPTGTRKINYVVRDGSSSYEITLNADGEWICHNYRGGEYPLPVSDIGEAIQKHYGT